MEIDLSDLISDVNKVKEYLQANSNIGEDLDLNDVFGRLEAAAMSGWQTRDQRRLWSQDRIREVVQNEIIRDLSLIKKEEKDSKVSPAPKSDLLESAMRPSFSRESNLLETAVEPSVSRESVTKRDLLDTAVKPSISAELVRKNKRKRCQLTVSTKHDLEGVPVNCAPEGKIEACSELQNKSENTGPFFSGEVITSEETKSEGITPIQNIEATMSATESTADAICLEGGAETNCSRYFTNADKPFSGNSRVGQVLNKSRDLPRRATSTRLLSKSKRLAMSRPLEEDPPNKKRKSSSENRRPPAPPYSTESNERSNVKNLVDLGPIIGNVKNEIIETDWSPVLQDILTDQKAVKREEIRADDSMRNGDSEEMEPDTISMAASSSSRIKSRPPSSTSYKEKNSSIKMTDCKLSQALIQFHLLGRKFFTLMDLGALPASHSSLATVVVVASMITSPFTSCLVVADTTTSSRLNLVGQAAKFWHSKLKIGQVLLLTKMGVLVEGGNVRVVQIACKEGVKVVGMAADLADLRLEQHCNMRVRMRTKSTQFCCRANLRMNSNEDGKTAEIMADFEMNANEDEETSKIMADLEMNANEDDDRTDVVNGEKVVKSSASIAYENIKKAVLADSDDSDEDLEGGINRENTFDIKYTEVKKKCEVSSDADDMVYHGMVYSLTEDASNDSSLIYQVIDDEKPNAASDKKSKEEAISSFDSLMTGERDTEVEKINTADDHFDDAKATDLSNKVLRKQLPNNALRHRIFKDFDGTDGETVDATVDDKEAMNVSTEHQHNENVFKISGGEVLEAIKVEITSLDAHELDDDTVKHSSVSSDGDSTNDRLGKRNRSKAAEGYKTEKGSSSFNPKGPKEDGDERDVK